jgi:tRNA dimethylallyltransferase
MVATTKINLVAIVGPTASGKSALAMKIAKQFSGEIIAADSRTIYRGMDIGTAKPSKADQAAVPHWGLDLAEPGESYSAARFKEYALAKITDISSRGKLPILVGGTGLYIDAVLFDYKFPASDKKEVEFKDVDVAGLQAIINKRGYVVPENSKNRRHLIRTIERQGQTGHRRHDLPPGVLLIGLMPPDNIGLTTVRQLLPLLNLN